MEQILGRLNSTAKAVFGLRIFMAPLYDFLNLYRNLLSRHPRERLLLRITDDIAAACDKLAYILLTAAGA